jgi:methionyl-tRNA formyltransferase
MRLAFLGTPEAALPSLRALVGAGHDVAMVITRPDRRRGRGSELSPSPVKAEALSLGLKVGHRLADLDAMDIERGIVVAYGAMIPAAVLDRIPMLNVHFSLLPRWRGAAPVERAILAGDEETGVGIMSLEETLDTGPLHAERRTRVDLKTATQLTEELARLGAEALVEVLASRELLEHPTPQVGEATYAEKLTKETFHLDPRMPAVLLERTVRLGRAFTFINGRRLKVLEGRLNPTRADPGTLTEVEGEIALAANDGALVLEAVQPEGSRPMPAKAWWDGARLDLAQGGWA